MKWSGWLLILEHRISTPKPAIHLARPGAGSGRQEYTQLSFWIGSTSIPTLKPSTP
jgi:hypothetical protein